MLLGPERCKLRVVIFGSRGMVGRALIASGEDQHEIFPVDRKLMDISDRLEVRSFLKLLKPEAIIMAAARVGGITANSTHQKDFLLDNLRLQDSVISSASELGIQKLIFLGSSCIYPRLSIQPISESALLSGPLEPTNEGYALAKIAGIKLCESIFEEDKLDFFSLMPTNLYGPNDNFDQTTSHVPASLMRKFHEGMIRSLEEVVVWGTGSPRREFMHVDDLANACWHMLDQNVGGQLINIGTGKDISIAEFAKLMARIVGFKGEIVFDTSKPDGTPRKLLDVTRANSLGWRHQIELEDGLSRTYDWFVSALRNGEIRGY